MHLPHTLNTPLVEALPPPDGRLRFGAICFNMFFVSARHLFFYNLIYVRISSFKAFSTKVLTNSLKSAVFDRFLIVTDAGASGGIAVNKSAEALLLFLPLGVVCRAGESGAGGWGLSFAVFAFAPLFSVALRPRPRVVAVFVRVPRSVFVFFLVLPAT